MPAHVKNEFAHGSEIQSSLCRLPDVWDDEELARGRSDIIWVCLMVARQRKEEEVRKRQSDRQTNRQTDNQKGERCRNTEIDRESERR